LGTRALTATTDQAPITSRITRSLATPVEVAAFLQVPQKTLYRWRSVGEGPPALKVGRHLRYSWSDVEAWLETRGDGRGPVRRRA
jgi:excisionase family DNA binding protein